MAKLKLRIQIEDNSDSIVSVAKDDFLMGRLPSCDLCLPYSEISRNHTHLFQTKAGEWVVEDLGSMNGTYLNHKPLTSKTKLAHGDVIQLGNVSVLVDLEYPRSFISSRSGTSGEVRTILHSAEKLQQQWIQPQMSGKDTVNPETAIARLQHLVEIAKGLSSAESIDGIFRQAQKAIFRELNSVQHLALLVDVEGKNQLKLLRSASRNPDTTLSPRKHNWISRSICKKVFQQKVAIKTVNAQTDKRFEGENSILAKGIHGAMAVPLWDADQIVGVLYADAEFIGLSGLNLIEDEDLSFFSAIANLVASSVQRWLLTRQLQGQEKIRQQLERYHSPAVVQQMIAVGVLENGRIQPVEADISILFADLVGFSALSERLTPAEVSNLLNRFFEEMLKPVFAAGGTLDKFIGDCIMAFFGAPEPQADHADRAVAAAKAMLKRLDYLNANNFWSEPLELRIAINSGKAVVGDVGSTQRVDYTVLGTTVNLAARMEASCAPSECIISEATYNCLKKRQNFVSIGESRFKGIDRPVQLYRLANPKTSPSHTLHQETLQVSRVTTIQNTKL